ncbi:MAG: tripartite tricarboxylate transporter substrate binding protein [Betaproteobacteria bacterium]|nr:tripartite tricarboxylate transporter substrate binding protein [Betaproteobacteria bacterium]
MTCTIPIIVSAISFALGVATASAQTPAYPSKPVRVIVSFAAGSAADVAGRMITSKLSDAFGQQFVVENRAGAAGNIGAEVVARAAPDGYTLLIVAAGITVNQSLFKKINYNLERDFDPVGQFSSVPQVLVVNSSLPVKSVKELIALAKTRPGQMFYASSGTGASVHIVTELFKMRAGGLNIVHVPYNSMPQAVTELVTGRVSMLFTSMGSVRPFIESGRLRVLAITSAKRSVLTPELPTIAESGLTGFETSSWHGMLAPAGTSRDIITRLNSELANIIRMPDIRERFAKMGLEPITNTPEEFAAYIKAEIAKWGEAVKASGATID